MSVPPIVQYPLDLDGDSPTNKIVGELREIDNNSFRAFVPKAGPFYTDSFTIVNMDTGEELVPVDDYLLVQPFSQASLRSGKDVQCAVVLKIEAPVTVRFDYQVVGGEYSWNLQGLIDLIEELDWDERPVKWGSVVGRPTQYPPAPHVHDIGDTYGWEYVVWQLERITAAILIGDEASHDELRQQMQYLHDIAMAEIQALNVRFDNHLHDFGNPHQTTKAQVGLGSVQNYGIATQAEARAGTVNNKYMTPFLTDILATRIATELVNAHEAKKNNPHAVTKAQVGLGNVDNFLTANRAQAESATVTDRFMTPQRTYEAIMIHAGVLLEAHVSNKQNPHSVTKAQVGLGNVDNFLTATQAEAKAGTSNNRFMTPLRTKEAIDVHAGNLINAHVRDNSNPHQVTKAQVGLGSVDNFATATQAQAQAGTVSDRFMTPQRTRQAIEAIAVTKIDAHEAKKNNPHAVTKAQVGLGSVDNFQTATQAEARAGASNNRFMTPLRVKEAIDAQAISALNLHVNNVANPHQVTKAQTGLGSVQNYGVATTAEAKAGTVANKYMTPQRTKEAIDAIAGDLINAHVSDFNNPHRVTKAQVGLSNIPNAITNSRTTNSATTLLTAKGMYDHVNSGDHDSRYVKINVAQNTSLRIYNNTLQAHVSGQWRQIWPPTWQGFVAPGAGEASNQGTAQITLANMGGKLYADVGGTWRQVWPPVWQN